MFFAKTREEAIRKIQAALCELVIEGVDHNSELHMELLNDPEFKSGDYYTDFYGKEKPVRLPVFFANGNAGRSRFRKRGCPCFRKNLFQKPKNDLENPGRSTKESHPSVPDELCLSCPKCKKYPVCQ